MTRTESIFILISIVIHRDLEIFKIGITAACLNTPMNEDVKHKWLMLDKDVASMLMTVDVDYWKTYLHRDGKILAWTRLCMDLRRRPTGGTRFLRRCSWTTVTAR